MSQGQGAEPHVRVDARQLESALLALRLQIMDAALPLETDGVAQAREQRRGLLTQIDDYLLPRIRASAAPVLVALVGSTGAGKSTLVNSIVGAQVSLTGIRRPTTNSPVLACHPDDIEWFSENVFLPSMPRVRQEGLAMPGRDGLLVLAANAGMPKGVALLDTPDIDSVVEAHHKFAHQFLDAADLWLFVTTASRYADAPAWELLRFAKQRNSSIAIVLSRVPPQSRSELIAHFAGMLDAAGLAGTDRFVIPETTLADGMLPAAAFAPIREWLQEMARREDRRVAVLTKTMSGVLDTFRIKVPELAGHLASQLSLRGQLRQAIESCYGAALDAAAEATADGSLLRGEVLARWQDFAGTGDLLRTVHVRRRLAAPGRPRRRRMPDKARVLKAAVSAALESLVVSLGDRAAEESAARWRSLPGGAVLLDRMTAAEPAPPRRRPAPGTPASSPFDEPAAVPGKQAGQRRTRGGPPSADGGQLNADGGQASADGRQLNADGRAGADGRPRGPAMPGRSAPDLPKRAAQAISSWQDHVMHLVRSENAAKRSIARLFSFDDESLALVMVIGLLGSPAGEGAGEDPSAAARELLTSVFGPAPLREIVTTARADLRERVRLLFDEEMIRFARVIDAEGAPDETAAVRLYEATYALEGVR